MSAITRFRWNRDLCCLEDCLLPEDCLEDGLLCRLPVLPRFSFFPAAFVEFNFGSSSRSLAMPQ